MQLPVPTSQNLTDRQRAFVERYVETGDSYGAAKASGYGEITSKHAKTDILNKPAVAMAIARLARQRLVSGIPQSIATIEWLRDNASSEKVRLDAATRLLGTVIVAPKAQDQPSEAEKPLHTMTLEELRAKVEYYERALAARAIDVTPKDPANDPDLD